MECCLQFSGWDFRGHIGLDVDGGVNRSQYRVHAQGKFQQCFQFCFDTKTPWVRLTGYPGGAWGFALATRRNRRTVYSVRLLAVAALIVLVMLLTWGEGAGGSGVG